jgi:hypothetical protein
MSEVRLTNQQNKPGWSASSNSSITDASNFNDTTRELQIPTAGLNYAFIEKIFYGNYWGSRKPWTI